MGAPTGLKRVYAWVRMGTKRVTLVIDADGPWGSQIISGVVDYASRHGRWTLRVTGRSGDGWPGLKAALDNGGAGDGLIAQINSPTIARMVRASGLACVNVSAMRWPGLTAPRVVADDEAAAALAANALLAAESASFAYCGPPGEGDFSDRLGGAFVARLRDAGQAVEMLSADAARYVDPTLIAAKLRRMPKPVAVFACDAESAFNILEACAAIGLAMPHDLRMIACDGALRSFARPQLAVIDQDPRQIGLQAAMALEKLMDGQAPGADLFVPPAGIVPGATMPLISDSDPILRQAMDFMRLRLAEPIAMGDVAKSLAVARRTLELRFKQAGGKSPASVLRRLRVEHACGLLAKTDQPIALVATSSGFTSIELLQRAMRRHLKTTPSKYRKTHRVNGAGEVD